MVFKKDKLQLQLLEVMHFEGGGYFRTKERPFYALSLRTKSSAEIEIKNKTYHLSAKDLAFFPANTAYIRRAKKDNMLVFHFEIQNFVAYDFEVLKGFDFEDIYSLFKKAHTEWLEKKAGYYYRANALLYEIFAKLRLFLDDYSKNLSPIIAEAIDYITANYTDTFLSVEKLAAMAYVSQTYFRLIFKRETGVSPKRYIIDTRMQYAKSLLNAGFYSVAEVAEKSGFSDAKNFSTAFKKKYGYPPSEQSYRLFQ